MLPMGLLHVLQIGPTICDWDFPIDIKPICNSEFGVLKYIFAYIQFPIANIKLKLQEDDRRRYKNRVL